jgi:leader peptidase (prepilin peptidase)/N-methyltransferase
MMVLMEFIIYLALILAGACLGSFAGATVWRLRARQLKHEKAAGERVNGKEYNRLSKLMDTPLARDRSQCLHCGEELKWYDLIPVISWLSLRGRCRYCRKPIGRFELVIELGMIAFFVASYALWPFEFTGSLEIVRFILWLVAGVVFGALIAYDSKWFLLPDRLTAILAGLGVVTVTIAAIQSGNALGTLLTAVGSVGIMAGLYFVIYLISKGKWVGFGDIKLGVGLGLLLIDWQLALVALFLANLVGCLVVIPFMLRGRLKRSSRVPFGPFLIIGTVLAQLVGPILLEAYLSTLL